MLQSQQITARTTIVSVDVVAVVVVVVAVAVAPVVVVLRFVVVGWWRCWYC